MNIKSLFQKTLMVTMLLSSFRAVAADIAGNVFKADGVVNAVDVAGNSRPLAAGDAVNVGDVVTSSEKSSLQIKMKDDAIISLSAQSALKINAYSFHEAGANIPDRVDLILQQGRLRTTTGHATKSGYTMTAGDTVVKVNGTLYDVLTLADGSMAIVLREGSIEVSSGGVTVRLDVPGTMVRISAKGQPPSAPEQAIPAEDLDLILAVTETDSIGVGSGVQPLDTLVISRSS
jgi:hypothetical protein